MTSMVKTSDMIVKSQKTELSSHRETHYVHNFCDVSTEYIIFCDVRVLLAT